MSKAEAVMVKKIIKKALEERFIGRELVGADEDSLRERLLEEVNAVLVDATHGMCEVAEGDVEMGGTWMRIYCEDGGFKDVLEVELEGETEVRVKVKSVRII
jgi:hypothetical protein